ncbi:MAG: cytochrome c peroxidase [Flavobacteriales bacterium]
MRSVLWAVPVLIALMLVGCTKDEAPMLTTGDPFILQLPPGAPAPLIPADNPLTLASVKLGKALFFDERLSLGRGISCASCHHTDKAFSDTVALSSGVGGRTGFRNAPSLANLVYHPLLMRDGGAPSLEQQVLIPLLDSQEMDATVDAVLEALRDVEPYHSGSIAAYGRPFDLFVLTAALASYERTLISGHSRFDRFLHQGDPSALSQQEQRGWAIFNGDRGKCSACHSGFDLSDHDFHNIGTTLDHSHDAGRQRLTLQPGDRGKFKTPTLRNIALTAPYMHDGSMFSLEEVIEHFNSGGLDDPNKSSLMQPLELSIQEKADLVAFLRSLTDERPLDTVE